MARTGSSGSTMHDFVYVWMYDFVYVWMYDFVYVWMYGGVKTSCF